MEIKTQKVRIKKLNPTVNNFYDVEIKKRMVDGEISETVDIISGHMSIRFYNNSHRQDFEVLT